MKGIIFALLLIFSSNQALPQDTELSDGISSLRNSIVQSGKKTFAIVGFTNRQGYGPSFALDLIGKLNTLLPPVDHSFVLVTRSKEDIQKIKDEQHLWLSGDFDPKSAAHIGRLFGAEAVIFGTFRVDAHSVEVVAQIEDTQTSEAYHGSVLNFKRSPALDELLGEPFLAKQTNTDSSIPNTQAEVEQSLINPAHSLGLSYIDYGAVDNAENARLIEDMRKSTSMQILMINGNNFFQNLAIWLQQFKLRPETHMQILLADPNSRFFSEESDMVYRKKLTPDELQTNKRKVDEAALRLLDNTADDQRVEFRYFDTQFRMSMIILGGSPNGPSCYLTVRLSPHEPMDSIRLEFRGGEPNKDYVSQCSAHFNKLWGVSEPQDTGKR